MNDEALELIGLIIVTLPVGILLAYYMCATLSVVVGGSPQLAAVLLYIAAIFFYYEMKKEERRRLVGKTHPIEFVLFVVAYTSGTYVVFIFVFILLQQVLIFVGLAMVAEALTVEAAALLELVVSAYSYLIELLRV